MKLLLLTLPELCDMSLERGENEVKTDSSLILKDEVTDECEISFQFPLYRNGECHFQKRNVVENDLFLLKDFVCTYVCILRDLLTLP